MRTLALAIAAAGTLLLAGGDAVAQQRQRLHQTRSTSFPTRCRSPPLMAHRFQRNGPKL